MVLNKIPFEKGSLETMIERLFKTLNAIDKQWSEKVEPATQKQIQTLAEVSGLKQHGKSIPFAYLLFLRAMGQNDNGLLEQEWDGATEVNIDRILEDYLDYIDDFNLNISEYMPFSTHWTESILFLKLTDGENPPVYYKGKLFSGSFENYLFQMAFRKMESTQFLYQIHCATSQKEFHDILSRLSTQGIQGTKPIEVIEHILKPYQLRRAWFSDDVRFYGISSEYIISVNLHWALNITVSSDNYTVLQEIKKSLTHLFGVDLVHW